MDMKKMNTMITVGLIGLIFVAACSDTSRVTRTGTVKDIIIEDEITPDHITVRAGDQVRWINQRMGDVRVAFDRRSADSSSATKVFV
jgi:plastocyanin